MYKLYLWIYFYRLSSWHLLSKEKKNELFFNVYHLNKTKNIEAYQSLFLNYSRTHNISKYKL